jgi:hypothetical protein
MGARSKSLKDLFIGHETLRALFVGIVLLAIPAMWELITHKTPVGLPQSVPAPTQIIYGLAIAGKFLLLIVVVVILLLLKLIFGLLTYLWFRVTISGMFDLCKHIVEKAYQGDSYGSGLSGLSRHRQLNGSQYSLMVLKIIATVVGLGALAAFFAWEFYVLVIRTW